MNVHLYISNVMCSEWKTFYRKMHSVPSPSPSQTAVIVSLRSRTSHGHNGQFCSQNMQSFSGKDRKVAQSDDLPSGNLT